MIKNRIFTKLISLVTMGILFFFLGYFPDNLFASNQETLYIRSDIKTVNGQDVESSLLILPAKDDYRASSFTIYKVTGSCPLEAKPDTLSAAKHDAFKNLLKNFGVKSIKSTSESTTSSLHEESILSYEGFILTPYDILSQGYDHKNKTFSVELEVSFAPIAYPPEWSFLYFKKKLYDALHNMISVFR